MKKVGCGVKASRDALAQPGAQRYGELRQIFRVGFRNAHQIQLIFGAFHRAVFGIIRSPKLALE